MTQKSKTSGLSAPSDSPKLSGAKEPAADSGRCQGQEETAKSQTAHEHPPSESSALPEGMIHEDARGKDKAAGNGEACKETSWVGASRSSETGAPGLPGGVAGKGSTTAAQGARLTAGAEMGDGLAGSSIWSRRGFTPGFIRLRSVGASNLPSAGDGITPAQVTPEAPRKLRIPCLEAERRVAKLPQYQLL